MKIQLAYRFTGENPEELTEQLKKIKSILENNKHTTYIPVLDPDRPKEKKALFLNTLKRLDSVDAILALIKSNEKSEGMLMEIGYAWGKNKKLIIAINKDVKNTHMREFADVIIEFSDINDLYKKLKDLKL
jgi:nucleoside 2-deoxyribosyltransferase